MVFAAYFSASFLFLLLSFVKSDNNYESPNSPSSSASPFVELFGETLYTWKTPEEADEMSTESLLSDKKIIGVYFSASWCGPCRAFTPILADFYKRMNAKGKKFEIIFVSKDRSAEEFGGYYSKMPWLAVPLNMIQQVNEKLGSRFQVKGIPHLVILDGEDASIITLDGRGKVSSDKYGLEFPWRPRSLLSIIPKPLRRMIERQVDAVKEKMVLVLRGVLQSLAPSNVVNIFTHKVVPKVYHVAKGIVQKLARMIAGKIAGNSHLTGKRKQNEEEFEVVSLYGQPQDEMVELN